MVVVLEAVNGPITGRRIEIRAGSILRIGRTTRSDYAIGEDSYLSSLHFAVECDGVQARVRDMGSSNGTFVNGNRITEQLVSEGDSLAAGESTFTIHLDPITPAAPAEGGRGGTATTPTFDGSQASPQSVSRRSLREVPPEGTHPAGPQGPGRRTGTVSLPGPSAGGTWPGFSRGQSMLLRALYQSPQTTVYAVLDAMRDSRIQAFLDASGERYLPLDPSGRVQVYVVAPASNGRLLDVLIKDGWGRGWGYFCVSSFAMEEVCAHLRNYITVATGAGHPLTFRFWDPRVLRVLAPALPPAEAADFFGPVTRILVEGEKPEIAVELTLTQRGPRQQTLMLV
jgi:hypothetical protein